MILLLMVIYLTFISLGLPDSVFGVVFPAIQEEWSLALGLGGLVSMIVISGTILSSLFSGWLITRLGTFRITLFSTLTTAVAILGFSVAPSWLWLIIFAAPLGFGGGSVDAALNHYVAVHFRAHHMNWLHAFWGIGATSGPLLIALFMQFNSSWRTGYFSLFAIQLLVACIIMASFSLWNFHTRKSPSPDEVDALSESGRIGNPEGGIRGKLLAAMAVFLLYGGAETSAGLWGSSYLVHSRGFSIKSAAVWVSLYYAGITVGRILAGFLSFRVSNKYLIRFGMITALFAVVLFLLPQHALLQGNFYGAPLILLGLGFAPVFPGMLHETPKRFGGERAAKIIGLQMAAGYCGSAFIPPVAGLVFQQESTGLFPLLVFVLSAGVLFSAEALVLFSTRK